jgi:hypothetical protein
MVAFSPLTWLFLLVSLFSPGTTSKQFATLFASLHAGGHVSVFQCLAQEPLMEGDGNFPNGGILYRAHSRPAQIAGAKPGPLGGTLLARGVEL